MNWKSNERILDSLVAVHKWLTVDFIHTLEHATKIDDEEVMPLINACQILKQEEFQLDKGNKKNKIQYFIASYSRFEVLITSD